MPFVNFVSFVRNPFERWVVIASKISHKAHKEHEGHKDISVYPRNCRAKMPNHHQGVVGVCIMDKMKKYLLINLFIGLSAASAFGQKELLYDGLKAYPRATIAPEIEERFKKQVLPRAQKYWREKAASAEDFAPSCTAGFQVLDGARGSFTKYDGDQQAYLYSYCGGPTEDSYQGVVVIENDRIISHFGFRTTLMQYQHIIARKGFFLLVGESIRDRSDSGIISAVEIQKDRVIDVLDLKYYSNSCDSVERRRCFYTAYKIYCSIGDGYFFYQEWYQKRAGKWTKIRPMKWVPDDPSIEREIIEPTFIK